MLRKRLTSAQDQIIYRHRRQFIAHTAKLDAMSPLKVLTRGYSMTQQENGEVVRSVLQLSTGDTISVLVSDGVINATVRESKENQL